MPNASERQRLAVSMFDPAAADRVLEVGCGHGVAASLIAARLDGGHLLAIDRSEKMIAAARRRNREHVEAGTAAFEAVALEGADLGGARFDKVFAFHVAPIWRSPAAAAAIRRSLAPGGSLHLFDKPFTSGDAAAARATAEPAAAALRVHSFTVAEPTAEPLAGGGWVTCVVARV